MARLVKRSVNEGRDNRDCPKEGVSDGLVRHGIVVTDPWTDRNF